MAAENMGLAMDTTKKRSWCLPCINEGAGTGGSKRFQKFCENSTNLSLSSDVSFNFSFLLAAIFRL
jgi:hypothetical protein